MQRVRTREDPVHIAARWRAGRGRVSMDSALLAHRNEQQPRSSQYGDQAKSKGRPKESCHRQH